MLTWLAIGLVPLAHAAPAEIRGTRWRLDPDSAWTEGEVTALEAFAATAPLAWTTEPVRLQRTSAGSLPDDLTTPHMLARIAGRRVTLALDGLQERASAWILAHPDAGATDAAALATLVLRRQFGHALTHLADDGWSTSAAWTGLSGWRPLFPWAPPAEERAWSFASPHGMRSAAEDLATVAERAWVDGRLPGESWRHPKCRLPTKWRQVEAFFQQTSPIDGECPALSDTLFDPDRIRSIELVYVRSSTSSPSSIAGHTLMALEYEPDATGLVRRQAYGIQALTSGAEGPAQMLRGLTGGFPSQVMWEPWESVALRYATREGRDILRFPLLLTQAQKAALLARLDELHQGWRRPYLFFTRNCGQLPLELIEAITGEPARLPPAFGPDALLGYLQRSGMLAPAVRPPLEEISLDTRADAAEELRRSTATALVERHPERAGELREAFRAIEHHATKVRQRGYTDLGVTAATFSDAPSFEDVDRYLAWSDAVELGRMLAPGQPGRPADPALQALRTAKLANRLVAQAGGDDLLLLDSREPLEAALAAQPPDRGSAHSPLRRLEISSGAHLEDGVLLPTVVVSTRLYETHLGEARLFSVAPGTEGTLMDFEVQAGLSPKGGLRSRWTALDLRVVRGAAPVANPGWYVGLLRVDQGRFLDARTDATWLEAGPVLEVWQYDNHRFNLLLSTGSAFQTDWGATGVPGMKAGASSVSLGVGLPVRVTAWAGSARQALTGVALEAEWRPVYMAGSWMQSASTRIQARVRLGEIRGVDVALVGEHRTTQRTTLGGVWMPDQEARLGIWVERY